MKLLDLLASGLLVAALVGCEPSEEDGGGGVGPPGGGSSSTSVPDRPTYQVLAADCPDGWTPLTVTTDSQAEVEYLDDMPACTNATGTATYLANKSDAVWLLHSTTSSSGVTTPIDSTLSELSFIDAVRNNYPHQAIFVPGAKLTVDLPPEEVEWTVDLPLSFGWQGHDLVVGKIEDAGKGAAVAALKRQSTAGAALAACTLAVTDFAESVSDLEDADPPDVVLKGLGVGVSVNTCRSESATVQTLDETARSVTLTDALERLPQQTETLEKVHVRLDYAQRAAKTLGLGLKFLLG